MAHDCANTRNNDDKQTSKATLVMLSMRMQTVDTGLDERQWELKVATWIYNCQI
jgi:hypothetical protein